jgi:anthranilate phosphoribosyltransferase
VAELKDGQIKEYTIDPTIYGMSLCKIDEIKGGTPAENAKILLDVLSGVKCAKLDISILNAASAIYVAGKSKDLEEGIKMARQAIENNKPIQILQKLIEFSNKNVSLGENL